MGGEPIPNNRAPQSRPGVNYSLRRWLAPVGSPSIVLRLVTWEAPLAFFGKIRGGAHHR